MKLRRSFLSLLILSLAILSCSKNVTESTSVTPSMSLGFSWKLNYTEYFEAQAAGTTYGFDPYLVSYVTTSTGATHIKMYAGFSNGTYNEALNITLFGSTTGRYELSNEATISYSNISDSRYFTASTGILDITAFQDVGGFISGAFNAQNGPDSVSGSFLVRRNNDL